MILNNESNSPLSGSFLSPAPALVSISCSTGPEGMTEGVGECKMKAGDLFVSCPGALFVLIWSFFPFFSSLLTLSVNELVLRQLTATLPALVRLRIVLLSQLKHRNTGKNCVILHSKTHCLSVLLSHITAMGLGCPRGCCLGGDASDVPQNKTFPFSVVPQLQGCSTAPSLSLHPSCVYCHATFSLPEGLWAGCG